MAPVNARRVGASPRSAQNTAANAGIDSSAISSGHTRQVLPSSIASCVPSGADSSR